MTETLMHEPLPPIGRDQIDALTQKLRLARQEVARAVVGQREAVDQLLVGLMCGGHVLLEGPPGVGKTLLVRSLGDATGLNFSRIQFTPDLMPADITGGSVLVPQADGHMAIEFQPGPVFAQIVLADEINRATPKTQAALLEAMQERTVTAGNATHSLPDLFFVLATQNPIEMDGTYRLPEAQIDRFLLKCVIRYPSQEELHSILDRTTGTKSDKVRQVITEEELLLTQRLVREVPVASYLLAVVARFACATQPQSAGAPAIVRRCFAAGLSPRGAQALVLAAKAKALLAGRYNVAAEDLRAMLVPAVRHRIALTFEGEAEEADTGAMLEELFTHAMEDSV